MKFCIELRLDSEDVQMVKRASSTIRLAEGKFLAEQFEGIMASLRLFDQGTTNLPRLNDIIIGLSVLSDTLGEMAGWGLKEWNFDVPNPPNPQGFRMIGGEEIKLLGFVADAPRFVAEMADLRQCQREIVDETLDRLRNLRSLFANLNNQADVLLKNF